MALLKSFKIDKDGTAGNKVTRVSGDLNVEGIIYAAKLEDPEYTILYLDPQEGPAYSSIKNRWVKFVSNDGGIDSTYMEETSVVAPSSNIPLVNKPAKDSLNVANLKAILPGTVTSAEFKFNNLDTDLSDVEFKEIPEMLVHTHVKDIRAKEGKLIPLYEVPAAAIATGDKYIALKVNRGFGEQTIYYTPTKPEGRLTAGDIVFYEENLITKE